MRAIEYAVIALLVAGLVAFAAHAVGRAIAASLDHSASVIENGGVGQ